ncbi:unnamed protein product [Mycena citricolor]|uniref:HMG box domain-containing protein n=1 Tax=Mycena citricolor TaxID=2018698 RepID=A0AAD2GTQ2_9AGAR|nr:unnamed protein product [Mycena citricolor]
MLHGRLASRIGAAASPLLSSRLYPSSASVSRAVLSAATRRTFLTTARASFPAGAATKPKAKATTTKAKASTAAKKKPAAKKPVRKASRVAAKKPKTPVKRKPKKKVVPKKAPRILKSQGPPSRRSSTFLVFFQEYMEKHGSERGGSIIDFSKEAGARYRAMSDAEKEPYAVKAREQTALRQAEYQKWIEEADPDFLRRLNKQLKASKKRRIVDKNRVKKPVSGYIQQVSINPFSFLCSSFSRYFLDNFKEGTPAERGKAAGAGWRQLSEAERQKYQAQAKVALDEWKAAQSNA